MAPGRGGRVDGDAAVRRLRYLVPSLLAAGFGTPHDPALAALARATSGAGDDPDAGSLLRTFTQDHEVTLAQHRSHSSHSSHRSGSGGGGHYSHTSHRSSTGGGWGGYDPAPAPSRAPAPIYVPRPAPAEPPPAARPLFAPETRADPPPADGPPALSGRTQRFASVVRRVQIALMARDLYSGAIDGVVGPRLRKALRAFQGAHGLDVTGTITPATLDALMVSSR